MRVLRLGMAQLNFEVGAIDANLSKIERALTEAKRLGSELVIFPELSLTGYPPEDLVLKPRFVQANLDALAAVTAMTKDIAVVVGFVDRSDDLYNAAAFISDAKIQGVFHKQILPNYGVFDELRYFRPGRKEPEVILYGDVRIGVTICEDIWSPYGPMAAYSSGQVDVVVNINASPFAQGKQLQREKMLSTRAADGSLSIAYVNMVGGQDELVFDGSSVVYNHFGELIGSCGRFSEEVTSFDLFLPERFRKRLVDPRGNYRFEQCRLNEIRVRRTVSPVSDPHLESYHLYDQKRHVIRPLIYHGQVSQDSERGYLASLPSKVDLGYFDASESYPAIVLGTRDYVEKNGFESVMVGLSGGVDSALVLTVAVDALGASRVKAIGMPTRYSSTASVSDAVEICKNLGADFELVSIDDVFQSYLDLLTSHLGESPGGITEENLQSRVRGTLLMALSNYQGALVLTTGNKSELATGYSTLYGDTAGGFAVIKDVPKTHVYELCNYRNQLAGYDLIPKSILTKPPSAELRPNQRDDDTLPSYDILDPILFRLIDLDMARSEVIELGYDAEIVEKVASLIDRSEYKRRQAPPGVRLTNKGFGKDRRFPITNGFR
jgi:NAD+ synthase (glutamine-hydrolysing)